MASNNHSGNHSGKNDRKWEAREKARLMREEAARQAKRRRTIWISSSVGGGIVIIAAIALIIIVAVQSIQPVSTAGPKNMASNGILLTGQTTYQATAANANPEHAVPVAYNTKDDKAHITTYIDFQCPYCEQFETANDSQILKWVEDGKATLEIHPIAILDNSSNGNKYSTRSANAAACVANYDPSAFFAVVQEFYKNQPKEETNGRTDAQILSYLSAAGASSTQITDCVHNQTYKGWVTAETNQALNNPLPNLTPAAKLGGTPTVIVNGKQYNGSFTDASAFLGFAEQASGVTLS